MSPIPHNVRVSIWPADPRRRALATAYGAYWLLLAYTLLNPGPAGPSQAVAFFNWVIFGTTWGPHQNWVEFGLNIVLFVPMGSIGLWLFRRTRPGDWAAIGFGLSVLVELCQRFLLPTRFGEARDVVANTAGALIGGLLGWALLEVFRRARMRRVVLRAAPVEMLCPPLARDQPPSDQ